MHEKCVLLLLVCALLTGCAVSREGVGFKPNPERLEERRTQLITNASRQGSASEELKLIVVGNTSAYRRIDANNIDDIYERYTEAGKRARAAEALNLTPEDLLESMSGWTGISFFRIPGVYGRYVSALVPSSLSDRVAFSSTASTFLWQGTKDLVAAITNEDGVFIVNQLLCKQGTGYESCKAAYANGIYDGVTGEELNFRSYAPEKNGNRIDTRSYRKLDETE